MENNEQNATETLENAINQGLQEAQTIVEDTREKVGNVSTGASMLNMGSEIFSDKSLISTLQPLTHTIHIITSKLEKQLEIAEITLEYINTDDSITIVGKVAGNTINTWILTEGMYLSKVIAQEVVQVVTKGKTPIGIVIFSAGSIISFFFAGKAEEIFKDLYFNQGRDTFKPLENFLQRHFNFPAKPSCPKGSTMPDGSCAPSPQEFWYPLFSFLFLSPYPKPSQAHQEALAKTKELKSKITLASSPHIQSDVSNGYIDERDLQEYKEQQYVLQKEQRLYTQALQDYTQELAYKSSILNFYLERLGDSILPHITENRGLTYNEALNLVSKNNYMIKILDESDIDSINVHSPFAYLRALFLCENIIVVDEQGNPTLNESNLFRYLGYKDDAAIIFALDKQTLTKDYLNKRKSLYKTIMNLREQREQDYKEEQERISQLSYEEYQREREKALREQQRQERMQRARNPNTTNHLILETKDKNNVIIFLDSDISLSNLIHIHNNKIDIFTKDGTILDIQRLETLLQEYININHNTDNNTNNNDNNTAITLDLLNSPNTQIFLYSQLLLGGSESPISSQEYFFGELDSKNSDTLLDTLKPIYYFAPKDESSGLGKLSIFYHSSTLTLLNYSIIDSSLNIKLECTSKESQKLLSNALSLKEKEYQSKTIQAQQSIATLHSLLENQEVKCIHGGKVILKSNKGKTFKSDGIPLILESDLLGSKISGCPRSVGGVSDPCTQVVNVKASLSQKKINGEYAILQELIGGCLSDKGFPLEVSFVPSKIKFDHSYDPKIGLTKQSLTTSQSFNLPILRLYYKEHNYQIDNTLIQRYTLNNALYELKEESNPQFFKEVIFEEKDLMDLSKSIENTKDIAPYQDKIILFDSLKQEFQKYYEFKEVTLNLGIHTFFLIFVIPKRIPKIYQKDYKALDSQRKDYGIGYFKELLEYNKDYKETNTQNNPYTPFLLYHTRVFLAPAKAKKIHFEFALGLDNYIESKDKESNTNVCKFKVLSGDVIEEREEVEGGDNIPDNVIRIETEDGSGEYIEIEFDENDNLKDINNDDELNDLLHQAKDILYELSPLSSMESAYDNLTAGEYKDALIDTITILPMAKVFKAKTIANKIENIISKDKNKKDVRIKADKNANANVNTNKNSNTNAGKKIKSKYATKQEVINVIENKYGLKTSNQLNKAGHKGIGSNSNVYWAKDNKQIKEIWDDIIEGAEILEDRINPKTGERIPMRKLSDGTILRLRKTSRTGGSAIDIGRKKPNNVIHNKAKEDGDW